MNSRVVDHPVVLYISWLTAPHTSSLVEFYCKRLTNLNEIRGTLLFKQQKVKQSTQFMKTKSTCCWKAGWVYKDSMVTSFRNQNCWLEMVIPPNLPHNQRSSVYYRFQSFPGRVTLNDKPTNSNQYEQSISPICVTTTTPKRFFKYITLLWNEKINQTFSSYLGRVFSLCFPLRVS